VRQGDWVWLNAREGGRAEPDWFDDLRGHCPNPHPGQLYNLRDDLPQRDNRYADQPGKVREPTGLLEQIATQERSTREPP
jgi:hypothetical protein